MSSGARVVGLEDVMRKLNDQLRKVNSLSVAGLFAGGLIIQRGAQQRVPVKTGNLKGSAFTRKSPEDANTIEVGFGAAYAIYVHENLQAHHDNGEAKFLENSVRDSAEEVVRVAASYARVK